MSVVDDVISELKSDLSKSLSHLKTEYNHLRTGRASVSLLDGISVDYYGSPTPLNQVATLSAPEPRLLLVQPWEAKLIHDIEKAIQKSDLGLNPVNDGKIIRLPIPQLTEERRRDLIKVAKAKLEETRVGIRSHRHDAIEMLKEYEKEKEISEDDLHRGLQKIDKEVEDANKDADQIFEKKEEEMMEV